MDITHYHWVWYTLGFLFYPKLTFMIWLSIYFHTILPTPLFIFGWVMALFPVITITKTTPKIK